MTSQKSNDTPAPDSQYHIRTEELSKTYHSRGKDINALKCLSMEVPGNVVMGFLGRNGAGKTTTIRILLGLVTQTGGRAFLMGRDVEDCPESREHVGYMPETAALDSRDDPVSFFSLVGRIVGISPAETKSRMERLLAEVGLEGREDSRFGGFSRGMKQRFGLAQALFANPKMLVLDEPFSGLDPIGRVEIRDLIARYNRDQGMTVFFSSHILGDVETLCDSIGIIDHGELKVVGAKTDLLGVESVEVSGTGVSENGLMFLEKMSDRTSRHGERLSVFLKPGQDAEKVRTMMEKYGASQITVREQCRSLENYFAEIVGKPAEAS